MRLLTYLIVIIVLTSCNNPKIQVNNEHMESFRYPEDSLIDPKVFVYETNDSTQRFTFTLKQIKNTNNNKILISVGLNNNGCCPIRDSTVSYYKDRSLIIKDIFDLVRDSVENTDKVLKTKIIDYIESSKKRILRTKYLGAYDQSIKTTKLTVDTIIGKTTLKVFDKDVECIIVASESTQFTRHKLFIFNGKTFKKSTKILFAKGIGIIYFETINHSFNTIQIKRLKEIIDYDTYLEKYCEKTK